jgi:hypothetical protein
MRFFQILQTNDSCAVTSGPLCTSKGRNPWGFHLAILQARQWARSIVRKKSTFPLPCGENRKKWENVGKKLTE